MLRSLHIENVAVIRRLDLDLDKGFTALTGETGAGKSMIIDSLNLLLGNRVPRDLIRTGEETATVGAVFDDLSETLTEALSGMGLAPEDGMLMLQRTLRADGRSQTRINGQTVTQSMQREIAGMLISIHGQSDQQKLLRKSAHLELLDAYGHPERELARYREAFCAWRDVRAKLDSVSRDDSEKLRLAEILRYQISDIDAMKLKDGEEETLTRERDRLTHIEKINRETDLIYRALMSGEKSSVVTLVSRAQNALRSLDGLIEGAAELSERLEEVRSEAEDIAETVIAFADDDREDPTARIDRIEGRLDGISKLKRKYGESIRDILAFRAKAAAQLEELETSDALREKLQKREAELRGTVLTAAAELRAARERAAVGVTKDVTESLRFLDMPKVRFEVGITPTDPGETGADDVEFLIATNPGEPLLPLIRIASGGELSRIMLALRSVLDDRDGAETVIFDEVDAGVSGKTSRKVGIKLKEISGTSQVLCVTHSAQIASLADTHFRIRKTEREGRAETDVESLSDAGRVEEIARILGGIEITDTQRTAAREMIEEYGKKKQ